MGLPARAMSAVLAPLLLLTVARGPVWAEAPSDAVQGPAAPSSAAPLVAGSASASAASSATPAASAGGPAASTTLLPGPSPLAADASHGGRLVVDTDAQGQIFVDDQPVGQGHWEGPVATGKHRVRVSAPEMRTREEELEVADQATRQVHVALEREAKVPWLFIAGGVVLFVGAAVTAYILMRPGSEPADPVGDVGMTHQPLVVHF